MRYILHFTFIFLLISGRILILIIFYIHSLENQSPSTEEIQRLYITFIYLGQVARIYLKTILARLSAPKYNEKFINYVDLIDNYMASISDKYKFGTTENASRCMETHKIIRMEPCNDNTSYSPDIMTP